MKRLLSFITILLIAILIGTLALKTADFLTVKNSKPYSVTPVKYPTVIAVGDIQCAESILNPGKCMSVEEANLVQKMNPSAILLLGDEQYGSGQYEDFVNYLTDSWGKYINIIYPVPGNHDYMKPGAKGYYQYFKSKNTRISLKTSYYSFNIDGWHIIALDSNCGQVGGCTPVSAQYKWLMLDLGKNTKKCTLAFFHHPLFSSGTHGNNRVSKSFWDLLYKYHADIVLNGHEHLYERFAPQTPSGKLDPQNGIRQFTVGTGGGNLYRFKSIKPNSEARNNNTYGILELALKPNSYSWNFIPVEGSRFTDSGNAQCH